jgi:hypothetical protein
MTKIQAWRLVSALFLRCARRLALAPAGEMVRPCDKSATAETMVLI